MQYAKVVTPMREALIALELAKWGADYQKLFNQTDVSGYEVWLAYRHNNFNNPFQQADEQRYKYRRWWAEIFRDVVREGGRGTDDKSRLNMDYVSHADTEWEKSHNGIWAPRNGWYVPTADGMFHEGTLIPFETVQDRGEAIKRLGKTGIPAGQVSYFWRPDKYNKEERFVDRGFYPGLLDGGRFDVDAGKRPSSSDGGVASRPAYGKSEIAEIVMEVDEMQKAAR